MIVSDFVNMLAGKLGRDPRELERYTRYLREAGMFPERVGGRKVPITASMAANLLLAILAADNATQAAEALKLYSDLRAQRPAPAESLIDFLVRVLERTHSDQKLRNQITDGTLYVFRQSQAAMFERLAMAGKEPIIIRFLAANSQPSKGLDVMARVIGPLLVDISIALADLPARRHLV